jgi:hypothetical protein
MKTSILIPAGELVAHSGSSSSGETREKDIDGSVLSSDIDINGSVYWKKVFWGNSKNVDGVLAGGREKLQDICGKLRSQFRLRSPDETHEKNIDGSVLSPRHSPSREPRRRNYILCPALTFMTMRIVERICNLGSRRVVHLMSKMCKQVQLNLL